MARARVVAGVIAGLWGLAGASEAACSGGGSRPTGDVGGSSDDASDGGAEDAGDGVVHTYEPTFTAVYGEIIAPACAGLFCHGAAETGNLSMVTKDTAYASLVNVPAAGPNCADAGLLRVSPGNPDASLLYLKVTNPPCGAEMPPGYEPYLDSRETAQIALWITLGAPND